jgi:uncharacterized membrane protein YbaN (DUF454 family)
MKKLLRIIGGVLLILVGIVGLILPVMPGWVFIIPGLMILAEYSTTAKRLLEWGKSKVEGGEPPRAAQDLKSDPQP